MEELVILLHGLGRGPEIMQKMQSHLQLHGFETLNLTYPSRKNSIQDSVKYLQLLLDPYYTKLDVPIHFVGHSLGAILIRYLLAQKRPKQLGKVVMLAPPNHGSEVAHFLSNFFFFRAFYGPALKQLGTDKKVIFQELPPIDYKVGIIAGNKTRNWLFSLFLLSGANDGKVTVASTELEEAKDHIVLPVAHAFLPKNNLAIQEVIFFITHGTFSESFDY